MKNALLLASAALVLQPVCALAQDAPTDAPTAAPASAVTSPAQFFPEAPGTDYYLANYTQYEAYLKRLASQSDRIRLVDIGKTSQGRTQWVAVVSSPANLARLEEYRKIAARLAKARGVSEEEARKLAATGKAMVWIDAGMHATETVTAQGQIQVLYKLLSQNDPETLRELDDCIILFAHDNPDGMEMVANWYMRHDDPKKREFSTLPELYQSYVGHDNNRDSFMSAMKETRNVNAALFRQWYPQIIYNQHQTGPAGMVVFVPPFRDPFNFNYDPIVMAELNEVGFAMHTRLIAEGKPGSGTRSAARYSTWHNGMERSVSYFHNAIGLLTEIIGGPTPTEVPLVPETQLPRGDEMMPIKPRAWHLQDSLDYQWTLNRAVIDYASRNRERLLFNIWRMGANSIARGETDSWTVTPSKVDRLVDAPPLGAKGTDEYNRPRAEGPKKVDPALFKSLVEVPAERDPKAYVIPAGQADMPTAVAFLNALIRAGVDVDVADAPFTADGKSYPAGSYVVRTAQAYRPHVLDMFEPQDHPHDTEYPGGPPQAPYDITGYTLAYQMGVDFARVLDSIDGRFHAAPGELTVPAGAITGTGEAGWIVGHESNNSFILTNRLLKAGLHPAWLESAQNLGGKTLAPGAIWIPRSAKAEAIVARAVTELGLNAQALGAAPAGAQMALKPVRIGLVDRYGGLISAGWTRWLLEQFEFPFDTLYAKRIDAGDLAKDYDVLLFADDALPSAGAWGKSRAPSQPDLADTPAPYRKELGAITDDKSVPQVRRFVEQGGAVVAIGSSGRLVDLFGVPLEPALARREDGALKPLDTKAFFIPGSILSARVDNRQPLAYGLPDTVDVFFNRAQTFVPSGKASPAGVSTVSWFEGRDTLRSGWAVGQEKLAGTIAVADVRVGKGHLMVMAPEVAQRAQSYGTFKFLFNGLLLGGVKD
ncbi:M14 family metallopeptidase [Novosphingobium sp. 1949]|uniref:M14 family metallopeptidase n=1 Tax=Novosphingobium organovorum TaxID=2930092 RepID=A0ABT0BJ25_9SPHN|nr:M14 metallopeptidase family protein [Novosphingobium organovorum]MCJ2184848.1 M14 family metallopeptidase [Novosphingobium organovorum]